MRISFAAIFLSFAMLPMAEIPCLGLSAAAQAPEYTATVTGLCPGRMTLEWSGARPNRRQAILLSLHRGQWTIPGGACQGTVLGLGEYVWLMAIVRTRDGNGLVRIVTGSGLCGGFVQLVESGTCRTSNVARVP